MKSRILIVGLFLSVAFASESRADTLHLKNGRSIEGLVKEEKDESIELDVGFGTVKFNRMEIEDIERSEPEEISLIQEKWEREKELQRIRDLEREKELAEERRRKEFEPKEVGFTQESEHILVSARINKKVEAQLLLDTGATLILLSSEIADKLKIKTKGAGEDNKVQLQLADGSKVDGLYVILKSVNIQGVEANDVGAVVLLKAKDMGIRDGLLGMSFLNKFNFQIDTVNKKLILQKREK